jgi:hypothetical protein
MGILKKFLHPVISNYIVALRRFFETNWETRFRGDTILGHKPSLGVNQTCPWIRKW